MGYYSYKHRVTSHVPTHYRIHPPSPVSKQRNLKVLPFTLGISHYIRQILAAANGRISTLRLLLALLIYVLLLCRWQKTRTTNLPAIFAPSFPYNIIRPSMHSESDTKNRPLRRRNNQKIFPFIQF